jgi:hypothetical protein
LAQIRWFKGGRNPSIVVILHTIGQPLSIKQRQEIESRLANYSIPLQILQMVAEQCKCGTISARVDTAGSGRSSRHSHLLAELNDESIILLQQIFLDCHDSFSNFRLAVLISSRWPPVSHKFLLDGKVAGKSGRLYTFDVCVYNRSTDNLVALGKQNNDVNQKASDNKSLQQFLTAIGDLHVAHAGLRSAYYASSYGYEDKDPSHFIRLEQARNSVGELEIRLLEYRNMVYFENKPRSR